MNGRRIALGLFVLLHVPVWFLLALGVGMGYRSQVDHGVWALKVVAVLLTAILVGCAFAHFRLILHAVTVVVVLALGALLLNDIKIVQGDGIPTVGVGCLPITALWLAFYAWAAWLRASPQT